MRKKKRAAKKGGREKIAFSSPSPSFAHRSSLVRSIDRSDDAAPLSFRFPSSLFYPNSLDRSPAWMETPHQMWHVASKKRGGRALLRCQLPWRPIRKGFFFSFFFSSSSRLASVAAARSFSLLTFCAGCCFFKLLLLLIPAPRYDVDLEALAREADNKD